MTNKNLNIPVILGLLLAILALLCACSKGAESENPGQVIEDISLEEAFALMEDNRGNSDFIIIDLRSAEEYAEGHIEGAVGLDYSSSDFDRELDELDRDKVYLLYSRTDSVSGRVLSKMAELGFSEVYRMRGGMERWEQIGLPQVK